MDDLIRAALDADIAPAAAAVQVAAVTEAGRQADALLRTAGLGEWPVPGSIEWHAEEGTGIPVRHLPADPRPQARRSRRGCRPGRSTDDVRALIGGVDRAYQSSSSTIVAFAVPPPSHMVCRP